MKDAIKIIIISVVLIGFYQLVYLLGVEQYFGEKFYPILISFILQSVAILLIFEFGRSNLDMSFSTLAMLAMVIRMLASLMVVVVFILMGVEDMTNFTITFFTIYLFYFVFEIKSVLSNLRSN